MKNIKLSTPESLEKLYIPRMVQDSLTFDVKKYKSFLEVQKKENVEDEEKTILNLDKIPFIKNADILSYLLIFIGGINSENDIYEFFDETVKNPNERGFIDNSVNYLDYLNTVIEYLKQSDKVSIIFVQMDILLGPAK